MNNKLSRTTAKYFQLSMKQISKSVIGKEQQDKEPVNELLFLGKREEV